MKAELLFKDKYMYRDRAIREMIIWQLPKADKERPHRLKYRLFYGYPDKCLVRYDNERGRHYGDHERNYIWNSVQQLMADFKTDIEI